MFAKLTFSPRTDVKTFQISFRPRKSCFYITGFSYKKILKCPCIPFRINDAVSDD